VVSGLQNVPDDRIGGGDIPLCAQQKIDSLASLSTAR